MWFPNLKFETCSNKRHCDDYDNDATHCVDFDNSSSTETMHNVRNDKVDLDAGSHDSGIEIDYLFHDDDEENKISEETDETIDVFLI